MLTDHLPEDTFMPSDEDISLAIGTYNSSLRNAKELEKCATAFVNFHGDADGIEGVKEFAELIKIFQKYLGGDLQKPVDVRIHDWVWSISRGIKMTLDYQEQSLMLLHRWMKESDRKAEFSFLESWKYEKVVTWGVLWSIRAQMLAWIEQQMAAGQGKAENVNRSESETANDTTYPTAAEVPQITNQVGISVSEQHA